MAEFQLFGAVSLTTDNGRDALSFGQSSTSRARAPPSANPSTCSERSWDLQHW